MSERFFVDFPITAAPINLAGSEAHHLIRVMRAKPGDVVQLFDGSGFEFQAKVVDVLRQSVSLEVLEKNAPDRELPGTLSLGISFPKGDRKKFLIEKLVEIGVHSVTPIQTERTVVTTSEKTVQRLERVVIEASKQCGRNRLMTLHPPMNFSTMLSSIPGGNRLIAHPSGKRLPSNVPHPATTILVGPEGGFTDAEIKEAEAADWNVVSLGPRIQRIEPAALVLASWASQL